MTADQQDDSGFVRHAIESGCPCNNSSIFCYRLSLAHIGNYITWMQNSLYSFSSIFHGIANLLAITVLTLPISFLLPTCTLSEIRASFGKF